MNHPALASQRHMRERMRAAVKRGLIAVLDVGSSKVACFILRIDAAALSEARKNGSPLGGYGALRVVGAGVTRSRGVRQGEIVDMEEAGRAIRTSLELAEKMAGERVDQVIGAFSGARPESFAASGDVEVGGPEVTEQDVARALAECETPPHESGREVLHALPVNYALDGATGLADPRGMIGERLGIDLHLVTIAAQPLRNLAQCVKRNDLELAGVVAAPYASALSSLVEDEQELGAACVDMGGGSTSISIFLRKQMIYADVARLGGDHVTLDIARGLNMSTAAAERLKTLHGGAFATEVDDREFIEAPQVGEEISMERRRIPRSALIGVIRPRIEEIFEDVRDRLERAGFAHLPGRQVVLTGGGCQMPNVVETAQRILGRRVRAGRPLRVSGLPQSACGPAFSAAVGLAVYVVTPPDELWDFEAPDHLSPRTNLQRAVRWFREHW